MTYGFIKSELVPSDVGYRMLDYPQFYEMKGSLGPVRNIYNTPKSVSVAITDMIDYKCRYSSGLCIENDAIFYHLRSNQSVMGMSVKEAILLAQSGCIPHYKVTSYHRLSSLMEVKSAIANHGPVLVALPVNSTTDTFWVGSSGKGLAAVLLTGYHPDGFSVRHCIGSDVGNKGYFRLPYEDFCYIEESWIIE